MKDDERLREVLEDPDRWLTERQRRWLRPRGVLTGMGHNLLYLFNWLSIRFLFRLSVEGRGNLPKEGPFILTPNHSSPLDAQMLGAALPLSVLQNCFWAGRRTVVLRNSLRRFLSWITRIMPIDDDVSALAPAVRILDHGDILIWFPEGKRSLDGELHDFKPGLAQLLTRCDVPVVPVCIVGSFDAFVGRSRIPRFRAQVVVRFGEPQTREQLGLDESQSFDVVAETLRQRVAALRDV